MVVKRKELHWGRVIDCYAERPADVNAMFADSVALSPDAIAVIDGARRVTYRELDQLTHILAANLAKRGVQAGDRVAVMLVNQLEAVLAVIAIAKLGAIIVPIGTRLKAPERAMETGSSPLLENISSDIRRPMRALGTRLCTQVTKKMLM